MHVVSAITSSNIDVNTTDSIGERSFVEGKWLTDALGEHAIQITGAR